MTFQRLTAATVGLAALALVSGAATTAATAGARTTRTLEQRVNEMDDYLAVQQLLGRYITATDTEDWAAYSKVFAKNGELIFMSNRVVGRAAIQAALSPKPRAPDAPAPAGPPRKLRHLLSNIDIHRSGDHYKGVARWVTMSSDAQRRARD